MPGDGQSIGRAMRPGAEPAVRGKVPPICGLVRSFASKDSARTQRVTPIVGAHVDRATVDRLVSRLDTATADATTPLGKILADLPATKAVELLGAVQRTFFGEAFVGPPVVPDPAGRERFPKPDAPAPEPDGGDG